MASSPEKEPLVRGGHARLPDKLPSMFISWTLPCIRKDTIIVGATHPAILNANPKHDGWFISDFYAFNYLLKGLGTEQKWLTAADPRSLIQNYGPYLHGNPYEERRVCLDREMLEQDQLTPVTVVKSSEMIERFLFEVKRASELARRTDSPLLLLVFCHGLPNHHLLLNDGNRKQGLSIIRLKGVLEPGVSVTLVTTACYSGGWATTPDLNFATMAAAGDKNHPVVGTSNAWSISQSIGRSCGSVFASTMFQALSSPTSPLIDSSQTSSLSSHQETLQPDEPSDQQTLTYNSFCQSVWNTCENRVTRLWNFQHFMFSAKDDAWEYSWTGRTGIPLADFGARWALLKPFPTTGPQDKCALRNPNPANPTFAIQDPNKTGGGQNIVNEMTDYIAHGKLKEMARTFHQTLPGEWDWGQEVGFGGILRGFYECDQFTEEAPMFESAIRFRWEAALLADYLIEIFKLPVPNQEICIMWNRFSWITSFRDKISDLNLTAQWKYIYDSLEDCLEISCLSDQGPPFYRPIHYMCAALIEADKPKDETTAIIDAIGEFMKTVRAFHEQRLCGDREVRRRGRDWLKTVGRRVRNSLSPRKERTTQNLPLADGFTSQPSINC
jgi:hypothetical protein